MNEKGLPLNVLFIEAYPQLVSLARYHRPEDPHPLVHQSYLRLQGLSQQPRDEPLVFEHVGAFVNFMRKHLGWERGKDKDEDWRQDSFPEGFEAEEVVADPGCPSLVDVMVRLRSYEGPCPVQPSSKVPPWEPPSPDEARDRSIDTLMVAFRENRRARAEGLIPLFRVALDPVWDAHFRPIYPEFHPVSASFEAGLNHALIRCLHALPVSSSRGQVQQALELAGLDYIPIATSDEHRADFDLKDQLLANYLTACIHLEGLVGDQQAVGKAVVLYHVDGLTYEQVAARMQVSVKQARRLIDLGLADLRRVFACKGVRIQKRKNEGSNCD